jgi:CRP-like cAMP-binding protein
MTEGALGRRYEDGEIIVRQGDVGDCLYVVQDGQVDIVAEREGRDTVLRTLEAGELLGEMAIFDHEVRSATARARGPARLLTVDKKNFMRRINEDPSIAFRVIETMSRRIRELSAEVVDLTDRLSRFSGTPGGPVKP